MIAAFLGMRLYSVLGQKAEHEEEAVASRLEAAERARDQARAAPKAAADLPRADPVPTGFPVAVERGLRDIAAADRRFEILAFMEGAKAAYEVILEAFWRGDKEELAQLCDRDVYESFVAAIDDRTRAGQTLDNRLIRIEESAVHSAMMDGNIARIAVRFVADIATVTRDKDGQVIAGSLNDAIESRDVWTFMRDVKSSDPNWLLDETDAG